MKFYQLKSKPTSTPWNKGKITGRKAPLKLKEIWEIRFRLQQGHRLRELVLFNLAIDSKLRGCDLVRLRVNDVSQGIHICHEPRLSSAKPSSLFSLRLLNKR